MTILHTIDTTGPGGAETVFIDLATRLPADKFRALVVISGKGWVYDELSRRGIEPILLNAKGSFNLRYLYCLCKLIIREKVDLVQSHLMGTSVYCSLAGFLTRKPVVATFHGSVDFSGTNRFKKIKFGAINMGASNIVAVSDSLRNELVSGALVNIDKTKIIYNGVDTKDFQRDHGEELRQRYGLKQDDVLVGSLGNIRSSKGYHILLQAASMLSDSSHTFHFVIAGHSRPGRLYDDLLKQREELGLTDRVHFLGFTEDPAGFLSNLDIFLLSSTSEGFSIATIQAMAAGLPVVATRSGGPEEIIEHGKNGLLVNASNADVIADALVSLVDDEDLCANLSKNARDHVQEKFGINVMLSAYEEMYSDLASKSGSYGNK